MRRNIYGRSRSIEVFLAGWISEGSFSGNSVIGLRDAWPASSLPLKFRSSFPLFQGRCGFRNMEWARVANLGQAVSGIASKRCAGHSGLHQRY